MKCPIDPTVDLIMTDRQGVEIDYCPTCRGVWLDRGELDKLIERSSSSSESRSRDRDDRDDRDDRRRDDDDRYRGSDDRRPGVPYKKKKSSFLGEMFDF